MIQAERKERERTGILRHKTRTMGLIQYELDLPGEVDVEHAEASLQDGVLSLKLPKADTNQSRRIPIL